MITRLLTSRYTKLRLAVRDRVQGLLPVSVRRSDPLMTMTLTVTARPVSSQYSRYRIRGARL